MKYGKNGQKFTMKTLQMCYLGHAEHHAKNRTSLRGIVHDTFFFLDGPLLYDIIDNYTMNDEDVSDLAQGYLFQKKTCMFCSTSQRAVCLRYYHTGF